MTAVEYVVPFREHFYSRTCGVTTSPVAPWPTAASRGHHLTTCSCVFFLTTILGRSTTICARGLAAERLASGLMLVAMDTAAQVRRGAPSSGVLERISHALMLTGIEREHLFLLALGRPPEVQYQAVDGMTPRLQRVLDALDLSQAFVRCRCRPELLSVDIQAATAMWFELSFDCSKSCLNCSRTVARRTSSVVQCRVAQISVASLRCTGKKPSRAKQNVGI